MPFINTLTDTGTGTKKKTTTTPTATTKTTTTTKVADSQDKIDGQASTPQDNSAAEALTAELTKANAEAKTAAKAAANTAATEQYNKDNLDKIDGTYQAPEDNSASETLQAELEKANAEAKAKARAKARAEANAAAAEQYNKDNLDKIDGTYQTPQDNSAAEAVVDKYINKTEEPVGNGVKDLLDNNPSLVGQGATGATGTTTGSVTETNTPAASDTEQTMDDTFVTPETEAQRQSVYRQEELYNTIDDEKTSLDEKYTALGELLTEKANNEVDEATRQAIEELNATLAEYTALYNQERQKAAYSQAQANDNMVLRNAAAGDLGGIGNKLYSDNQGNYDAQITQINLEQANLMSDTARQIAELTAQGEYTKAQNVLEIGISNLQNMIDQENQLISWKMSLASNLDNLDMQQQSYDESVREYNIELALNKLQLGMFSSEDAEALGVSESQAQAYADYINTMYKLSQKEAEVELANLVAASRGTTTDKTSAAISAYINSGDYSGLYAYLLSIGYNNAEASSYIKLLQEENATAATEPTVLDALNSAGTRQQFISNLMSQGYSANDAVTVADEYVRYFDKNGDKVTIKGGSPEANVYIETPDAYLDRTTGFRGMHQNTNPTEKTTKITPISR